MNGRSTAGPSLRCVPLLFAFVQLLLRNTKKGSRGKRIQFNCRLSDQLLVPFALAVGGSFRTFPLTNHFETNRRVIESFLPVKIRTTEESRSTVLVEVKA